MSEDNIDLKYNKEDLNNLLQNCLPNIITLVKTKLTDDLVHDCYGKIYDKVSEQIIEWIEINLVPCIKQILLENKDGLMKLVIEGTQGMLDGLVIALKSYIQKKSEDEYNLRQIMKAIFY